MQGEAVAVGGAGAHWQQVVVAGDVAISRQVIWVLRVTGNHCSTTSWDNTDGWLHVVDIFGRHSGGRSRTDDGGRTAACHVFVVGR